MAARRANPNPDAERKRVSERRARKNGATLGPVDFQAIRLRDRDMCWICGKRVAANKMQFDHVIPLARGGEHAMWNIRVTHGRCNGSKGSKDLTHQLLLPVTA